MNAEFTYIIKDKEGVNYSVQAIQLRDAWALCDFIVSNEDRLSRFFPTTREANLTPDLSKRFVEVKCKEFEKRDEFLFTVKPENSRRIIGLIYIKELDWNKRVGELAYCIDYNFEGKGITTHLVELAANISFDLLKLNTIQIITHKSNIPSVRVAQKSNFVWIKTLIGSFTPPGESALNMELYERNTNS